MSILESKVKKVKIMESKLHNPDYIHQLLLTNPHKSKNSHKSKICTEQEHCKYSILLLWMFSSSSSLFPECTIIPPLKHCRKQGGSFPCWTCIWIWVTEALSQWKSGAESSQVCLVQYLILPVLLSLHPVQQSWVQTFLSHWLSSFCPARRNSSTSPCRDLHCAPDPASACYPLHIDTVTH